MGYPTFKQVLKHVKKALIENKYPSRFICFNIEYVLEDTYGINRESVIVTRYQEKVQEQLGSVTTNTYEKWMKHFYPSIHAHMTPDNFREGRIQWIDHMIKQEEANEVISTISKV